MKIIQTILDYNFLQFLQIHRTFPTNQSANKIPMRRNTPQEIKKRTNTGSLRKGKVSKYDISQLPRYSASFSHKFLGSF